MGVSTIEIREKKPTIEVQTGEQDIQALAEMLALKIFVEGDLVNLEEVLIIWQQANVEKIEQLRDKISEELAILNSPGE